jgi:alkylation response protein AidB-like acyl-CoA dehydrogenase
LDYEPERYGALNLHDSPEEHAFRMRVRSTVETLLAAGALVGRADAPARHLEAYRRTQAALHDAGLVGVTWPPEFGGQGASQIQQIIINQELVRAELPRLINWIGIGMCGPAIIVHGTDAQKERYLAPLLRADELWCQLFSEPGAGSDLAGVSTRATRTESDGWRVTGQKVWTTGAQWCDFGLLLARTDLDVPKHRGLTMFLIDMKAAGVSVRPLRDMTGENHFNEVFLDDVLVPDSARVGAVDDGWRVAITMLMNERYTVSGDGTTYAVGPDDLCDQVRAAQPRMSVTSAALVRQEFAACWVEALACRMTGNRLITAIAQGKEPGAEGSVGKLASAALVRRAADLGLQLEGDDAVYASRADGTTHWHRAALFAPGVALAGGTTEVMKNIIAERVLRLPPEPRVDVKAGV